MPPPFRSHVRIPWLGPVDNLNRRLRCRGLWVQKAASHLQREILASSHFEHLVTCVPPLHFRRVTLPPLPSRITVRRYLSLERPDRRADSDHLFGSSRPHGKGPSPPEGLPLVFGSRTVQDVPREKPLGTWMAGAVLVAFIDNCWMARSRRWQGRRQRFACASCTPTTSGHSHRRRFSHPGPENKNATFQAPPLLPSPSPP